jgi:integrase
MESAAAYGWLQEELSKVRRGADESSPQRMRWSAFAVSCLERRIATKKIKSAKNRIVWGSVLKTHLIPAFGDYYVDQLRFADFERWQLAIAAKINAGKMAPTTGNNHLRILRTIMNDAVHAFRLDRNPLNGIEPFDTSEHEVYSDEEPNALTVGEVRPFLVKMRELCPQHFAMVALGFATGLRPSSLRPLRKGGETPDVLWKDGVLLVRRSQTVGDEVMNTTKTCRKQRLALPEELVEILRWHVDVLPEGPMTESELLFPNEQGGFRSPAVLQKPFAVVSKAMRLQKHISPRAMRRTFQDLARAAEVKDIVTRSISGHATEDMQQHYSTVAPDEMRSSLAKVISLGGFREAHASGSVATREDGASQGGGHGGGHPRDTKTAS